MNNCSHEQGLPWTRVTSELPEPEGLIDRSVINRLGGVSLGVDPAELPALPLYTTPEMERWLDHNAWLVDLEFQANLPLFEHAAMRREPGGKGSEVFFIHPEATDWRAEILREQAVLTIAKGFSEKDGEKLEGVRANINRQRDPLLIAVMHGPDGVPVPMAAMHARRQGPDRLATNLAAVEKVLGRDLDKVLAVQGLTHLKYNSAVLEVVSAVVLDGFKSSTAGSALFNAICTYSQESETTTHFAATLDGPLTDMLNRYGRGFEIIGTVPESTGDDSEDAWNRHIDPTCVPAFTYDAPLKPRANLSGLLICDIETWQQNHKKTSQRAYDSYWSHTNAVRTRCELTHIR